MMGDLRSEKFRVSLSFRILRWDVSTVFFFEISRSAQPFSAHDEDVWMFVATKLFALALISCVSMTNAWKWPVAFSVGMAVLVGVCQPYMHPQAGSVETSWTANWTKLRWIAKKKHTEDGKCCFFLTSPKSLVKCLDSTVFQVSQLQTFSYVCLALTSVAFIYDWPWLARVALMAPVILLFWQARKRKSCGLGKQEMTRHDDYWLSMY